MPKEISLDEILLSKNAVRSWAEVANIAARAILARGKTSEDIPDERARVEEDGSLTIYVVVADVGEFSLKISRDQWGYRH